MIYLIALAIPIILVALWWVYEWDRQQRADIRLRREEAQRIPRSGTVMAAQRSRPTAPDLTALTWPG